MFGRKWWLAGTKQSEVSAAELKQLVTIKIAETETMTLLNIPGVKVWAEDEPLTKAVRYVDAMICSSYCSIMLQCR